MTREMIQLSPRGNVIYQFYSLTVLFLLLYAAGFLLSVLGLLPEPPLSPPIVKAAQNSTAHIFKLLCLTGFVSAGFMMADENLSGAAIAWQQRLWFAVAALIVVLSPFDFGSLLDSATALPLLPLLAWSSRSLGKAGFIRCWQLGLLLTAITLPLEHIVAGAVATAIAVFQVQVAFGLCALSIVFWLAPRYSSVDQEAAQESLHIAAALLCLGGSLNSLGRLGLPEFIGLSAAPLIVLCFILLASHVARALRQRNENASLATHWIALATLFWLVGSGFLGALSANSAVSQAVNTTDFPAAQDWLGGWIVISIVLAFGNEAATSLRGDNRRVTGYAPLWLIGFGVGLAFITQLCRGVVQFYLREFAAPAPGSEAESLLPITVVWLICLLAVAAGIVAYALGFYLRRPEIRVVER